MHSCRYSLYIIESIKITLFCVVIVALFEWVGADKETVIVTFNIAAMSAAASFSPYRKKIQHITLGSAVIVLSIVLGGLLGFYSPVLSKVITIIYAALAFLVPRKQFFANILITGALMFLVFTSLPFNYHDAILYLISGFIVMVVFGCINLIFNRAVNIGTFHDVHEVYHKSWINGSIISLSLLVAWVVSVMLELHTTMTHLYWISLTIMVVIQGSQRKNIITAVKRIVINLCGAIMIIVLFNYMLPEVGWINLLVLLVFLFLIFAFGFSYILRSLFIEMFVLGFSHLMGSYHDMIAVDRILLTGIGGLIVIIITLLCYFCRDISTRKYQHNKAMVRLCAKNE